MTVMSLRWTRSESSASESQRCAVRKRDPGSRKRFDVPGVERQTAARHFIQRNDRFRQRRFRAWSSALRWIRNRQRLRERRMEIVMTCVTMNDASERKAAGRSARFANASVRLLAVGYSIAAAALRLKNTPALQLMTIIFAAILLAITFLSSDHVNRESLVSGSLFLLVNIYQLLLLLWELRPVTLHGEKRMLHDLIFPNLTISAFNRLTRLARWRDGKPGDILAIQGSRVTEIVILLKGSAEVERDGGHVATLGAGAIIGEMGALSAQPFSSTIRLAAHSRCLVWKKDALDHFFACHPSIASGFQRAFISRLQVTPVFRPCPESDEFQG
jgi:hypothetical protein